MSTVFLSYSSSDVALAVRIRDLLIARGYPAVFRDKDPEEGIPAGARWADEIFLSLDVHDIVVFLATAASLASPWCHTELAVAVARRKYVVQISTEPVKVHPVLSATQSIGPIADVEALIDQLVSGLSRVGLGPGDVAAWDPNKLPYPGLKRLTERHAAVLFGREREVGAVLDQLSRPQPLPVLVVGPSGSGKSSLVRAGVVPRLKRKVHTVVLPVVEPGADPLGHLAAEVEKADAKSDARQLVAEPDALSLAIDRLIAGSEDGRGRTRPRPGRGPYLPGKSGIGHGARATSQGDRSRPSRDHRRPAKRLPGPLDPEPGLRIVDAWRSRVGPPTRPIRAA